MQTEKYLTAKQIAELEKELQEIEVWAAGLLDKCSKAKLFLRNAAGSAPAPVKRKQTLSDAQLAEISAKRRKRLYKE